MKVSLLEFIKTGYFGPIVLGVSRHEVEKCFDAPPAWTAKAKTYATASIWKYGDIEFYFDERGKPNQLCMILMDDFYVPCGEGALELDAGPFYGGMTLEAASHMLPREKIEYEIKANEPVEGLATLTISYIKLVFDEEDQTGLRSIHTKK